MSDILLTKAFDRAGEEKYEYAEREVGSLDKMTVKLLI
jgi:hypothetical protein